MPPCAALIMVVPTPTELANPLVPDVLLMVDMRVFEELQETNPVISCVVLSENVPVAMNCWVLPRAMLELEGVTVIEVSTAGVTVSVAVLEKTPENEASMVVVPSETAVAKPFERALLLMVATPVFEEIQVAHVVNA